MWGAFESRSLSLSEKEERRRRVNREGRRSQGRSPLCVTVFTFSNITKPHQQVLVSSMEIPETTELDHVDPDGEGGGNGTRDPS